MKIFYYLETCDTCKRILKELNLPADFQTHDIKASPLTEIELAELKSMAGSFEALFSKRARLYKERNLKEQQLSEENYKALLLEHYTFLKRPVLVNDGAIFVGNSKKTVEAAKASIR